MKNFEWRENNELVYRDKFVALDLTTMKLTSISECIGLILMRVKELNAKMFAIDLLTILLTTLLELSKLK